MQSLVDNEYWWRKAYFENEDSKLRKPIAQFDPESGRWQMEERAAWLYELVRRLPKVKTGDTQLVPGEQLLSFPNLHAHRKATLESLIEELPGDRPLFRPLPPRIDPRTSGYAKAIPPYQFDLRADDRPLQEFFMAWINSQREEFGIIRKTGSKGVASHNQHQIPLQPNWRWVELMDHVKGKGEALSDTERRQRSSALTLAKTYFESVRKVLLKADEDTLHVMRLYESQIKGRINDDQKFSNHEILNFLSAFMEELTPSPFTSPFRTVPSQIDEIVSALQQFDLPES